MTHRHSILALLFLEVVASIPGASEVMAANNPVPYINEPLLPAAAAPGAAGFTLTVRGAGFVASSAVQWNGSSRVNTFVSSTELTATIPSTDLATAGTAVVTVLSPGPG